MSRERHFASFTLARTRFRDVLDAARQGLVTTIDRDRERFVVTSAASMRRDLSRLLMSDAVVVAEGGGWAAFVPGVPVHGDADTFDHAIDDLVRALREYAEDWNARLLHAPNHERHRSLVALVELSTDAELRDWLLAGRGGQADPARVPA